MGDISCDIAGPIACTIRPSKIGNGMYGYDPMTQTEVDFMQEGAIAVMAIDNLPCELPKDASEYFGNELLNFKLEDKSHIGIILSFIATFWASTGNLVHQKNSKDKIPFIQSIAYGMLYGSLFTLIVAKFRGAEIIFDNSISYILSFLYLSIIGSVVAFYLYLKLLENIGSARAGYIGVIMPIIALIISTIFEGLQWTNNLIFGLSVLIFGCVLILNQKSKKN